VRASAVNVIQEKTVCAPLAEPFKILAFQNCLIGSSPDIVRACSLSWGSAPISMAFLTSFLSAIRGSLTPRRYKRMREEEEHNDTSTARGGSISLLAERVSKQHNARNHVTPPETILPSAMLYGSLQQGKKFKWTEHPPPRTSAAHSRRLDIPDSVIGSAVKNIATGDRNAASAVPQKDNGFPIDRVPRAAPTRLPAMAGPSVDLEKSRQRRQQQKLHRTDAAHSEFYGRFWERMQSIIDQSGSPLAEVAEPISMYNYHYDKAQRLTKRASSLLDSNTLERRRAELQEIESSISRIRTMRLQPKRRDVYPYKRKLPLPKMTAPDVSQLQELTRKPHLERVLIHEPSKVRLTGGDLSRLAPGNWLNDEIINLYMRLLQERDTRLHQRPDAGQYPKCHFFNSFFLSKLYKDAGQYDYDAVRRWTMPGRLKAIGQSRSSILDCDRIIVPVNQSNMHWTVAVIDIKNKRLEYFDSLLGQDDECLEHLAQYLVDEFKNKRGEDREEILDWKRHYPKNIPRQRNGYDCGVFLSLFANSLAVEAELVEADDHFRVVMLKQLAAMEVDLP
jgi:hypothetical protein